MNEQEKLRVLIPHWIEHNQEHADEFVKWASSAGNAEQDLLEAAHRIVEANKVLSSALEKLGGAIPYDVPHSH